MRVLAIGNMYPPHHLGGYELVWRSAMRYLREQGHETRVLCSDLHLPTTRSSEREDDADVFRELRWYWRDHRWPYFGWRARVELEVANHAVLNRHLDEFAPDVVSWWSMGGMSLSLMEAVRRRGIPAVAFLADDWVLYAPKVDPWTRAFRGAARPLAGVMDRGTGVPTRVSLDDCARYVAISQAVLDAARSEGLTLPGATIAHLGVDPAFLDPRPARAWAWRLLYVGRIDERKGIEDAVRALTTLPSAATLKIIGEGDPAERRRLERLVADLRLTARVDFAGMVDHDDLPASYEACDVVVFPVRWSEPWGIVPLEAMALGRPVVATGMGGSGEYLVDGVNCLLSPPSDPEGLAHAVVRLADDPALRARLVAGGADTAHTHTEPVFNAAVLEALLADGHQRVTN